MKFLRFKTKEGLISYGMYENSIIFEINGSIYDEFNKTGKTYNIEEVKLLTPCEPSKIFGIGRNFKDHIKEMDFKVFEIPSNFYKPSNAILNTGEDIIIPKIARKVHYEGELALVIKDKIKEVSPEEAKKHVLGVTCFNDVTESYMPLEIDITLCDYAKGFDTFAPFGPIIDTEIDPNNTVVRTYLNGKKVQEGYTKDMIFSPYELVSFVSKGLTLYPGDVIITGTPSGISQIKEGDVIEVEIEGIDIKLSNGVKNQK